MSFVAHRCIRYGRKVHQGSKLSPRCSCSAGQRSLERERGGERREEPCRCTHFEGPFRAQVSEARSDHVQREPSAYNRVCEDGNRRQSHEHVLGARRWTYTLSLTIAQCIEVRSIDLYRENSPRSPHAYGRTGFRSPSSGLTAARIAKLVTTMDQYETLKRLRASHKSD